MANPYTTQTIANYNDNPPPDDGSQAATNEIKWSTHKDELADPIKTLAEAINTELLSAFALTFGQGIATHSTNYTVVAGDRGNFLSVTGTTTITLLAAATAGDGFPLGIINTGSGIVTVDGNGAETINGNATVTLYPNDSAIITCNGTLWVGAINYGMSSGTWTPTVQDSSLSDAEGQTYTANTGVYRAIGDTVFISGSISISGLGTLTTSDQVHLAGLPFASANPSTGKGGITCYYGSSLGITANSHITGVPAGGQTYIQLWEWDQTTGSSTFLISELTGSGQIDFFGQYTR